ncbi:MAG: metallophosphoesterase [Candidatus Peribacteraceae bacterium]|nr:metallophosphoesterase [Candidatus Peribacteraceae bacterium]
MNKTNSIALLGDLHIGARNSSNYFREFFRKNLKLIFKDMCNRGITDVYQLGDFLDSRRGINSRDITFVLFEILSWLEEYNLYLHILAGNHDLLSSDNSDYSTLYIMRHHPNIRLHFAPSNIITSVGPVGVVPWINKDNHDASIKFIENTNAKILFGHFAIDGFKMQTNGIESKGGLSQKLFKRFDAVFSGHYHSPDIHTNIAYLGTPWHLTWADHVDTKGWYEFDGEKLEFVEQPDSLFSIIEYDETVDVDLSEYEGRILKVVCNERTDEKKWKKFKKAIGEIVTIDYTVIDNTVLSTKEVTIKEEDLSVDTLKSIKTYVNELEEVETEKLTAYLSIIYNRCEVTL